jgi:hypothetical protein
MRILLFILLFGISNYIVALEKVRDYNEQINFIFNLSNKFLINEIGTLNYTQNEYKMYKITYGVTDIDNAEKHLIISGMHGNEIAPIYAIRDFILHLDSIEMINNITIDFIYILNPYGFEYNVRHNGNGIDLNRDFVKLESLEINNLINSIKNIRHTGVYDFHEHSQTTGFFMYYYSSRNRILVENILAMLKNNNIQLENEYVDVILKTINGSIFVPFYAKIYFMSINRQATSGLYFDNLNIRKVFVFETPKNMELDRRIMINNLLLKYIFGI